MKKILSLVFIITILCNMYTPAYADNALNEAMEYLSAVGIDFEYEEETISPDKLVTRAVFAQNISKLLNMPEIKCNNVYYHDVSKDHWAFNNIGTLTELGILNGNGDKYFHPDEYVSKEEAATIIITALGYGAYADNSGGYPNGYLTMASELGLFENCIFINSDITLSDMLIMLRNALDVNVVNTGISSDKIEYTKSADETVLNYYHKKYYEKGTLIGCEGVTLENADRIPEDEVIIDGFEYTTEITGLLDLIGTEIEFLYEAEEADSDERELIWVKSLNRNDTVDVQKDKYCSYDSTQNVYSYLPEGIDRMKNIKLSGGIIVIYNGAVAKENVEDIFDLERYTVRFIRSKNSSVYDIAIVWKYDNMVVGQVDSHENVIYDKFDHNKILDVSDEREKIVIENGKTLDQIEIGDVLSYYESEDGKLLKIEISKNVRETSAKYINSDEEKILFSEDGEFIFYDSNAKFNVVNGEIVNLYLDKKGYIVYLEKVKNDSFPAYLIKVAYDESTEELFLKTLDYDGKVVKRKVAENAKLDASKAKFDVIYSALTVEGKTVSQVVVLRTDKNDQIKMIDTVDKGENETQKSTLKCSANNYRGQYKHHGRLVPKVLISPSTVVFSVPSVATNDDRDYTVKSKSDFDNDQWYTVDVYDYLENKTGYSEILVIKDKTWSLSGNSTYVLVDKITNELNSDDEAVEKLFCNKEGNMLEYTTTADFSLGSIGAKSGDLVELSLNIRGEIDDAEIRYSYGSTDRPINNRYNAEPGLRVVYVHEKIGNVLKIGYKSSNDFDEIFEMPQDRIVVYEDNKTERIRKGTMWDIVPGMTIAIQTIDETPWFVVVYK